MARKKKIESTGEAMQVAKDVVKKFVKQSKPKKELPKNGIEEHAKFAKFKGEK